jgi:hypothetical protein
MKPGGKKLTVSWLGASFALGRDADAWRIWGRDSIGRVPIRSFPPTDEGWRAAWGQFSAWEPAPVPVTSGSVAAGAPKSPGAAAGRPVWVWIAVGVIAALIATGGVLGGLHLVASRSPAASHAPSSLAISPGYLATGSGFVVFVQWQNQGARLSGSYQAVASSGQAPSMTTESNTLPLSGTVQGATITLSFDDDPDVFGTLSADGSFTVNVALSSGSLAPLTFKPATPNGFNAAVASLDQQVAAANQSAASAQATQNAEAQVDQDATAVANDLQNLTSEESAVTRDVQAVPGDLTKEAQDLTTTQSEEQTVQGEAGSANNGQTCYDAGTVEYDAGGVSYDAGVVEYDANSVESDLSQLRTDVASTQSAFAKLQSAEAAVAHYQPVDAPDQAAVTAAVNAATAAASSAVSTTNGYIDQANADVTAAYQAGDDASQAGSCDSSEPAPSPQAHIS